MADDSSRNPRGAEKFFWLPLRDYPQALAWYRHAADHGNSNAENQLGYTTEEGWSQPQIMARLFRGITKPQNKRRYDTVQAAIFPVGGRLTPWGCARREKQ